MTRRRTDDDRIRVAKWFLEKGVQVEWTIPSAEISDQTTHGTVLWVGRGSGMPEIVIEPWYQARDRWYRGEQTVAIPLWAIKSIRRWTPPAPPPRRRVPPPRRPI